MEDEERFENLLHVLDDLREANETTPIVVEGQRDVASLRELGCAGRIVTLHRGDTLFLVAEAVAREAREVILLTDWDRKGGILFDQLGAGLAANGVRVDRSFRDRLPAWTKPPVRDVESLAAYVARGRARFRPHEPRA